MIVIDIGAFYAYAMPWLKQFNSSYNVAVYRDEVGDFHNAIDDQVLAQILGLTEA
jgi:hypothetical protein